MLFSLAISLQKKKNNNLVVYKYITYKNENKSLNKKENYQLLEQDGFVIWNMSLYKNEIFIVELHLSL